MSVVISKKNIDKSSRLSTPNAWESIVLGMNGVAMARNGPILWENDATGSRKVFKYLPDLWEAIKNSKIKENVQKRKNM